MDIRLGSTTRIMNITHTDNRGSIDNSLVGFRRKRGCSVNDVFALREVKEAAIGR